jgi:hypothetical protein
MTKMAISASALAVYSYNGGPLIIIEKRRRLAAEIEAFAACETEMKMEINGGAARRTES